MEVLAYTSRAIFFFLFNLVAILGLAQIEIVCVCPLRFSRFI